MSRIVGYVGIDDEGDAERVIERLSEVASEMPGTYVLRRDPAAAFGQLVDTLAPEHVPSPAFVDQARRNAEMRQAVLAEFGGLDAKQVHELSGSRSRNARQTASRWRSDGLVFAVEYRGRTLYAGFQFDIEARRPKRAVAAVLRALPVAMRGWELASWWTQPQDALQGRRPADVLDHDPASVLAAAAAESREWTLAAGEDLDVGG